MTSIPNFRCYYLSYAERGSVLDKTYLFNQTVTYANQKGMKVTPTSPLSFMINVDRFDVRNVYCIGYDDLHIISENSLVIWRSPERCSVTLRGVEPPTKLGVINLIVSQSPSWISTWHAFWNQEGMVKVLTHYGGSDFAEGFEVHMKSVYKFYEKSESSLEIDGLISKLTDI